jgi:hypothetical protein
MLCLPLSSSAVTLEKVTAGLLMHVLLQSHLVLLSLSLRNTVVMMCQIIVPENADRKLPELVASITNFGR